MSCGEVRPLLAELALGVLDGRDRAAAMAHVEACGACREELRHLGVVADELAGALPGAEPPAGFEAGALARITAARTAGATTPHTAAGAAAGATADGATTAGATTEGPAPAPTLQPVMAGGAAPGAPGVAPLRRRPRARLGAVAAASVLALLAAGAAGFGLGRHGGGPALRRAAFSEAGRPVGEAYLHTGPRSWMYVEVALPATVTDVTCQLLEGDRVVATVGSYHLYAGRAAWGVPVPSAAVTGARLVDAAGAPLAGATFSR